MIHDDDDCSWLWLKSRLQLAQTALIQVMEPALKKLKTSKIPEASAPPQDPVEMRLASWNLGVPNPNSNMGQYKISTFLHYHVRLVLARMEQAWSMILFQEVNEHWASVAAGILQWEHVWNDKLALCWDMSVWELLAHEVAYLFTEEERKVKYKKDRKVQVAPS